MAQPLPGWKWGRRPSYIPLLIVTLPLVCPIPHLRVLWEPELKWPQGVYTARDVHSRNVLACPVFSNIILSLFSPVLHPPWELERSRGPGREMVSQDSLLCVSTYICVSLHLSVPVCIHAYLFVCLCMCTCVCFHVYLCVSVYMSVCAHVYLCISVCLSLSLCMYLCVPICIFLCLCPYVYPFVSVCIHMFVCVFVCLCICTYVSPYIYMCLHVYSHVYLCVSMCVYVCTQSIQSKPKTPPLLPTAVPSGAGSLLAPSHSHIVHAVRRWDPWQASTLPCGLLNSLCPA